MNLKSYLYIQVVSDGVSPNGPEEFLHCYAKTHSEEQAVSFGKHRLSSDLTAPSICKDNKFYAMAVGLQELEDKLKSIEGSNESPRFLVVLLPESLTSWINSRFGYPSGGHPNISKGIFSLFLVKEKNKNEIIKKFYSTYGRKFEPEKNLILRLSPREQS